MLRVPLIWERFIRSDHHTGDGLGRVRNTQGDRSIEPPSGGALRLWADVSTHESPATTEPFLIESCTQPADRQLTRSKLKRATIRTEA